MLNLYTEHYLKIALGFFMLVTVSAQAALRDPTQPTGYTAQINSPNATSALVLTAIFTSSLHNTAVINGEMFQVGDKVNRFKITRITPQIVSLESAGETIELALIQPIVKNPLNNQEQGQ